MNAFVNLLKPIGLTAHDCIARLRKIFRQKSIGHGGTLDPLADGVLPVAVGRYTRLLGYLRGEKVYRALIQFGICTDTDDITGKIVQTAPAHHLTLALVNPFLRTFLGTIVQRPPAYSAIQVQGKRLYDLARQQSLRIDQIPLRTVQVKSIEVVDWQGGETPALSLDIACGTGTYIRSIARDLGELLNTGATLAALTRLSSNGFELKNSHTLAEIATAYQQNNLAIVPAGQVLSHLDSIKLNPVELARWQQGQAIAHLGQFDSIYIRTYSQSEELAGISTHQQGRLLPKVVL